jgi:hypothetical protein
MKTPVYRWKFQSSSGTGTYETLKYNDGSLSCDCPGWTRRAIRSCKHTRWVEAGEANAMAQTHCALTGKTEAAEPEPAVVTSTGPVTKGKFSRKFV